MLDIPKIAYFKGKNTWCASRGENRCRIAQGDDNALLEVFIWRGPFSFEKTPPQEMTKQSFEFSTEGLLSILEYLEDKM